MDNNYRAEVAPQGWKLSSTSGTPAWGSGIGSRSPQSIHLWKMVRFDCRNSTGLGETDIPPFKGAHNVSCTPGPRGRSNNLIGAWTGPDLPASTGGFPTEAGAVAIHCGDKDTDGRCFKDYPLAWTHLEANIFSTRSCTIQQPVGSSAEILQAKQQTGWNTDPVISS